MAYFRQARLTRSTMSGPANKRVIFAWIQPTFTGHTFLQRSTAVSNLDQAMELFEIFLRYVLVCRYFLLSVEGSYGRFRSVS
jgi:hypothetical protein